ncbi:MAG TPA: SET domain-containing protein-lysine N-methyltransferase [Candidatus Saccharimonadales bacterium]|nr:SET domain-containing protein-lysine N-methyltransferase [Candidatus Saccharimonadales bacterium]
MANDNVRLGEGEIAGKAVYAARDFKKGEVVIAFQLQPLTYAEYKALPASEQYFTHTVNGQIVLYPEPARYVSHSENPNVVNDHARQADVALRDIRAGELICVDARQDDVPVLKKLDAVLVKVPSIEEGLEFYRMQLGQITRWKKQDMAAVRLGDADLVLSTKLDPETDMLVESVAHAVEVFVKAGGSVVVQPEDIDVGMMAVVQDPFGNRFTLIDLSKGTYQMNEAHEIIGIEGSAAK